MMMGSVMGMKCGDAKQKNGAALLLMLAALALLAPIASASQPASSPISVALENNHQSPNDDRYFKTDVYGTPVLTLSTSSSTIVLSPAGANQNDLPPNAILCPGPLTATLGGADIKWAHTYFDGSTSFPLAIRPIPPKLGGGNPATSNIPIVINSAMANELDTAPLSTNHYVRHIDANNIWNRLDAITTSDQNVRYLIQIGQTNPCVLPYCSPSNASKASLVCRGKAVINSAEYDLTATDTPVPLGSSYQAGQSASVSAQMRLDKCVGVIHALPDNVPSGTSGSDRMYLFSLPQTITFPSSSGTASLGVQFRNPVPVARVIGTYGPYSLSQGQSTTITVTVENDASSVLPFQVTGVSFVPGSPHGAMSVSLVQGATILAGQSGTIQVRITQGAPAYNGNIDLAITGASVGLACNGTTMGYNVPFTNLPITNGNSCTLSPNPAYVGAGASAITASCVGMVGGRLGYIDCPAFTWASTAQNVQLSPSSTQIARNPSISASYSGIVSGGTITATGGGMACSTPISCAPLSCVLSTNVSSPSGNIITPPKSALFTAACSQSNSAVMCPKLEWSSNLTGVSASQTITQPAMSPQIILYTSVSTPQQSGWVKADAREYCANFTCNLPSNAPVIISNNLCRMPCKLSSPMAGAQLTAGLGIFAYAECNDTVASRSYVTCPAGDWFSDAGAMSPAHTAASSSPSSSLTVSNVSGTYIKFNYTDFYGGACSCQLPLKSALPDYVPQLVRMVPSGVVPVGGSVTIYAATKNDGGAAAVNQTNTTVLMPSGMAYQYQVPPLAAGGVFPTGGQAYTYTCTTPGLKNFTIMVDSGFRQAESNETNNDLYGAINCGGVLLCADYI